MKRVTRVVLVIFGLFTIVGVLPNKQAQAQTNTPTAAILIAQIKITSSNGQFIALFNNTSSEVDMSTVQLAYYNYYDLTSTKLTSSRFIPLSGKLPSKSYYMVSDTAMMICYKMTVNAVSLGFSATAGTVQVIQNGVSNVLDSVAWSKTAVTTPSTVQTLPSSTAGFLQRAWLDGVAKTANDPWVSVIPAQTDGCELQTLPATNTAQSLAVPTAAPQKVADVAPALAQVVVNIGLVAPELTELFPNPAAPQSDDTDEFIELYNPNDAVFNLSGYRVESGVTYSRGYTFTTETLQPKSFTSFPITATNLQLSNGEGRARLLSPDATTISETPSYEDAPEGESWSKVGDSWQWTNKVTSGTENAASLIESTDTPAKTTTAAATKTTAKKSTAKVAGVSTVAPNGSAEELEDVTPLHPLVLAGVGTSAVAYALYEYRKDMANQLFKLRRYFKNRRAARAKV